MQSVVSGRGVLGRCGGAVAVFALLATACGGPTGPSSQPPPADSITLTCPSNVSQTDVLTPTATISYPAPTAAGGVPPITVTCSPATGSSFALGTTPVTCNATDGPRSATCSFSVRLDPLPVIRYTRFMAFGDSITAGELQPNALRTVVEPDKAYPAVLSQLLSARYHSQAITMFNEGLPRDSALDGSTRIRRALSDDSPEVLLLVQGVIDLGDGADKIPQVINALRSDIFLARNQGVREVFLGTLLPQKRHLDGFPKNEVAMEYIEEANDQIRALASREGVNLVDLYAAMAPEVDVDIGGDGLHPTQQGFIRMADTFFEAIKAKLDVTPAAAIRTSLAVIHSSPRLR